MIADATLPREILAGARERARGNPFKRRTSGAHTSHDDRGAVPITELRRHVCAPFSHSVHFAAYAQTIRAFLLCVRHYKQFTSLAPRSDPGSGPSSV